MLITTHQYGRYQGEEPLERRSVREEFIVVVLTSNMAEYLLLNNQNQNIIFKNRFLVKKQTSCCARSHSHCGKVIKVVDVSNYDVGAKKSKTG